ncbi:MAG: DUF4190 domain-containing protein [Verrucomicrobia bacterium]|nr:DUF4190 domain-containing protein [Verrucomicrobiota bacterium]
MNYKVIGTDRKEYGPISGDQVRQWIAERRLNALSLGQAEGSGEWKPLSMTLEFQGALSNVAPPPEIAALPLPASIYPRTNGMAVLGLVMGIMTVTFGGCCCYGFPFNILGVIFSCVAISQINSNPQVERGKGLAIAGLVLSILGTVLVVLAMIFFFAAAGLSHKPHLWRL